MMALRAHARGGPEQLVYEQAPVPVPGPGELAKLAQLTDQGRLRAVVSQTFPLRDGRRAFESGARPRPPGKTVLLVR